MGGEGSGGRGRGRWGLGSPLSHPLYVLGCGWFVLDFGHGLLALGLGFWYWGGYTGYWLLGNGDHLLGFLGVFGLGFWVGFGLWDGGFMWSERRHSGNGWSFRVGVLGRAVEVGGNALLVSVVRALGRVEAVQLIKEVGSSLVGDLVESGRLVAVDWVWMDRENYRVGAYGAGPFSDAHPLWRRFCELEALEAPKVKRQKMKNLQIRCQRGSLGIFRRDWGAILERGRGSRSLQV